MFPQSAFTATRFLRFAVIGVIALAFCSSARCDDKQAEASKAGAHSRTLARILASWKARQERTRSFHFTWNTDASWPKLPARIRHKAHTRRWEFWMADDNRYRLERSLALSQKPTQLDFQSLNLTAFDGKFYSNLLRTVPSTLSGHGSITETGRPQDLGERELQALLIVFRLFHPTTPWQPDQFRLIAENAIVDGVHCVKLERSRRRGLEVEYFWADPRRGDAVVFWELQNDKTSVARISLQYKMDKLNGWIPSHWTTETRFGPMRGAPVSEATVTQFAINEELPADTFQIHFPPDTEMAVALGERTKEQDVIAHDGSKGCVVKLVYDEQSHRQYIVTPDGTKIDLFNLQPNLSENLHFVLKKRTDFAVDPQPLREAIELIGQRFHLPIAIDDEAFLGAGIEPSKEVKTATAQMKMWELLMTLVLQCHPLAGIVERDGKLVLTPLSARDLVERIKSQGASKPESR